MDQTGKRKVCDSVDADDLENKKARVDYVTVDSDNICDKTKTDGPKNILNSCKYLREKDVGITEHVSALSPFSGIIKQRYSDFIVNEIDACGEPVILTSLQPLEKKAEVVHDLSTVFSADVIAQLNKIIETPETTEPVIIKVNELKKEERQKIHETIRQQFRALCSNTEDRNGEKVITIQHSQCIKQSQESAYRKPPTWPSNQPNYMQFIMYKENKDTMDAINFIAKSLRMKSSSFTYAGVKDKRAKTSQLVTVYRVASEKLSNLKIKDIKLGNFNLVNSGLKLGDLDGNRFKIVIRNVTGNGDIEEHLTSLKDNGFINYYGMQRFGTSEIFTHQIGKALLLNKWQEAIELILKPRNGEHDDMTKCRRVWWDTRDAAAAYAILRRRHSIEGQLLQGLMKHNKNDVVNALNCIPRNTRLMYIHSYQSYIWNLMVSKRIKKFGMQLLNGDLIFDGSSNADKQNEKPNPIIYKKDSAVENVDIYDVVMPLPGFNSVYPDNEIATWYQEILKEESINMQDFSSKVKAYSLGGSYRKIFVKPKNLTWSKMKYSDPTKPLTLSDYEILSGDKLPEPETNGRLTAISVEFTLPSSSYATMALREVINVDTSVAFQKSLNETVGD